MVYRVLWLSDIWFVSWIGDPRSTKKNTWSLIKLSMAWKFTFKKTQLFCFFLVDLVYLFILF